jgi:hypothetical protein
MKIERTRFTRTPSVSDLLSATGSRSDGAREERGEGLLARVLVIAGDKVCGSGVDADDILEVPGGEEDMDDARSGLASSTAWLGTSIASRGVAGVVAATTSFG